MQDQSNIPYGFCQCGCGGEAPIATMTSRARGWVKGEPKRFIHGHHGRIVPPPYTGDGLCECGCGELAPISTVTRRAQGLYAGQPYRFKKGHNRKGVSYIRPAAPLKPQYAIEDRGYETPCWVFTGCLNKDGYGQTGRGSAHRAFYIEAKGPIPKGLELDHLCSIRACVNPDHLEPVTHAENVRRGALTPLTASDVREIRARAGYRNLAALGREFGVSGHTIGRIVRRQSWADV